MGRHVKHPGLVPEDGLGAIAVVHVPVQDQDPLALLRQGGGGDGHGVEQAEPHGLVRSGMVARRAMGDKAHAVPGAHERLDRRQSTPGGQKSSIPGTGARFRVDVERASPGVAEVLQGLKVLSGMCPLQLIPGGSARRQRDYGVHQVGAVDAVEDGLDSLRALRVQRSCLVVVQLGRRTQVEHALEVKPTWRAQRQVDPRRAQALSLAGPSDQLRTSPNYDFVASQAMTFVGRCWDVRPY